MLNLVFHFHFAFAVVLSCLALVFWTPRAGKLTFSVIRLPKSFSNGAIELIFRKNGFTTIFQLPARKISQKNGVTKACLLSGVAAMMCRIWQARRSQESNPSCAKLVGVIGLKIGEFIRINRLDVHVVYVFLLENARRYLLHVCRSLRAGRSCAKGKPVCTASLETGEISSVSWYKHSTNVCHYCEL